MRRDKGKLVKFRYLKRLNGCEAKLKISKGSERSLGQAKYT